MATQTSFEFSPRYLVEYDPIWPYFFQMGPWWKYPRLGLLFPDSKHKAKSGRGAGNKRAGSRSDLREFGGFWDHTLVFAVKLQVFVGNGGNSMFIHVWWCLMIFDIAYIAYIAFIAVEDEDFTHDFMMWMKEMEIQHSNWVPHRHVQHLHP